MASPPDLTPPTSFLPPTALTLRDQCIHEPCPIGTNLVIEGGVQTYELVEGCLFIIFTLGSKNHA